MQRRLAQLRAEPRTAAGVTLPNVRRSAWQNRFSKETYLKTSTTYGSAERRVVRFIRCRFRRSRTSKLNFLNGYMGGEEGARAKRVTDRNACKTKCKCRCKCNSPTVSTRKVTINHTPNQDDNETKPRSPTDEQGTYIRRAVNCALRSDMLHRHGCVVVHRFKGDIVSSGYNRRTSSSSRDGRRYSVHAEMDALSKIKRACDLADFDMYVVRISGGTRSLKLSRPCSTCWRVLSRSGLRRVFFSVGGDGDEDDDGDLADTT
jgi:tRNA(Arg) A34 adenosine deaminase TadA